MTATATTADHLPGIQPQHLKELHASGLSDDTIREAKIYSETSPAKIAAILDWKRPPKRLVPAIVFPFVDVNGNNGYAQIKPDTPRKINKQLIKY